MGHFVTSADIPVDGEKLAHPKLGLLKFVFGGIALLGLIASVIIWLAAPEKIAGSYAYSYLFGYTFFLTLCIGGCFWTLLHNVSNSGWGTSVRRIFENLGFVFPFMFILSIPFLIPVNMPGSIQPYLYEWLTIFNDVTAVDGVSLFAGKVFGFFGNWGNLELNNALLDKHEAILATKSWYMNPVAWYIRTIFYFASLGFVIWHMRKLSVKQDTDPEPGVKNLFTARAHASWGLPIFGVALTFWAVDFVMALDYKWFSTMWGVYFFAGCALSSMATIILTTIILKRLGYLKNVVSTEHFHLMGKLNFAFVVFWAYVTFSQFFLYWYANITEETSYYLLRNTEGWNVVSIILVFGHFAIPFVGLIRQDLKKNMSYMTAMTIYLLTIHALDVYHMVIPERGPSLSLILNLDKLHLWLGNGMFFLDILGFITVGSAFMFFYLRNISSVALYPHRDPRILESANVHN